MFFVVDMPYNAKGQGPEMDPDQVVGIDYEVWDTNFLAVATFKTEEEAEVHCNYLIEKWMTE